MEPEERLLLMAKAVVGAIIPYALPKTSEHLPLRVIYEILVTEILKRRCGVRSGFRRFLLPEFDKQVFHERTNLAICSFPMTDGKGFIRLAVMRSRNS